MSSLVNEFHNKEIPLLLKILALNSAKTPASKT